MIRDFVRRHARGLVLLAAAAVALALAGCGAGLLPSARTETDRLKLARRMMADRDYMQAIEMLKTYIVNNGGSADVDEAIVLYGECALRTRDWATATVEFERVLRDFPESDSAAAASFMLGEAHFGQSRPPDFDQEYTEKALVQWQSYLANYPNHWRHAEAERRVADAEARIATKLVHTGNLYLKLNSFKPARVYFNRVLDEFPNTPQVAEAMIGLALVDARIGIKDRAIERLKEVETRWKGTPIGNRAIAERARIEH
jgi:outer membrane protein assembly factor BamD